MLADARNTELYSEWFSFIEAPEVRAAFCYLVGLAASSRRYRCHIQWKGAVRDFRFHDASGEQSFSFISNQQWLLFYFRPSAIRSKTYSRTRLADDFDSLQENTAGEWTLKLKSIADVRRLSEHIDWSGG
jgi:hypothetical protein